MIINIFITLSDDTLFTQMWLEQLTLLVVKYSPVTIIVVTIFIAIFQNYRIVFLLRYFMCVRNDIFARYLRYANTIELTASLLKFQHASITCRERHDACDCRPATVAEQRLRPWKTPQLPLKYHVTGGLRDPSRLYDVTAHNYQRLSTLSLSS